MYYAIGVSVPSLHRESTDSLIHVLYMYMYIYNTQHAVLAEMPLTTHPLHWAEPQSLACTLPLYT